MRSGILIALAPVSGVTTTALAGPPFQTDDPELPDPGEWEFTVPATYERDADGSVSGAFIDSDINYGLSDHDQLSLEVPWEYARPPGGPMVAGIGDTALEYKWGCHLGKHAMYAVNLELTLPTGDERRGLGSNTVYGEVALLYERTGGGSTWLADVTWAPKLAHQNASHWFFGTAYLRDVGGGLQLGGEVYANSPAGPGGDYSYSAAIGGTWDYADDRELMFSVGRGLDSGPDVTAFLGVNFTGIHIGGKH